MRKKRSLFGVMTKFPVRFAIFSAKKYVFRSDWAYAKTHKWYIWSTIFGPVEEQRSKEWAKRPKNFGQQKFSSSSTPFWAIAFKKTPTFI